MSKKLVLDLNNKPDNLTVEQWLRTMDNPLPKSYTSAQWSLFQQSLDFNILTDFLIWDEY